MWGTAFLVFSMIMNEGKTHLVPALVMTVIYCFGGPISGAHLNPAVTVGTFFINLKVINLLWVLIYFVAQGVGCILAIVLHHFMVTMYAEQSD
jgi:glycerol uptake facilitator-like aquaporin